MGHGKELAVQIDQIVVRIKHDGKQVRITIRGAVPTDHNQREASGEPSILVTFEWDPVKSETNEVKHGINFEEAKAIWQDPGRAVLQSKHDGEPRQLTIGLLDGKMYTVVTTTRDGVTRIISARRSRKEEEAHHAEQNHD